MKFWEAIPFMHKGKKITITFMPTPELDHQGHEEKIK